MYTGKLICDYNMDYTLRVPGIYLMNELTRVVSGDRDVEGPAPLFLLERLVRATR